MTDRSPLASMSGASFRYPDAQRNAFRDETWQVEAGTFTLVTGPSGSGKSSLLRSLNGLVPAFSGGAFGGTVTVDGRDTRHAGPRGLGGAVGFVFQDPEAQLVTNRVEDEIAFGLEQAGVDRGTMRKRVEEALDALGIEPLRHRRPDELSGGERQRVAIAAALATHPRLLVLDEPTSQLDPWAAEDVLTVLARLNEDLGLTVVAAEHRLERLLPRADDVRVMARVGTTLAGPPGKVARLMEPVALPAVTRLGRTLATDPLPLTVKQARAAFRRLTVRDPGPAQATSPGTIVATLDAIDVALGGRPVLAKLSLDLREGELVAVMGRNGSGKTTLLRTIAGLQPVVRGRVATLGADMAREGPRALAGRVGYVPQQASTLFFQERLLDELRFTARVRGIQGDPMETLDRFGLGQAALSHPLDLSGGERMRAALATVMIGRPRLLLLDEPTRGMDAWRKTELGNELMALAGEGVAVVMVTHDVELVAASATRVVLLGDGGIVADGPPRETLTGSLTYSTQINRVFGGKVLTVADVLAGLDMDQPEAGSRFSRR